MTKGWTIVAVVRPGTRGSSVPRGRFVVAIPDKAEAASAVQERLPDADIKIDSEASAEFLKRHLVRPGEVFVLMDDSRPPKTRAKLRHRT